MEFHVSLTLITGHVISQSPDELPFQNLKNATITDTPIQYYYKIKKMLSALYYLAGGLMSSLQLCQKNTMRKKTNGISIIKTNESNQMIDALVK